MRSFHLQEPAIEALVEGSQGQAIPEERQRAFAPASGALRQEKLVEDAQKTYSITLGLGRPLAPVQS